MSGLFITFEGGEGSGKSTQIVRLARRLEAAGLSVRVIREPGGTAVGEAVRQILLHRDHSAIDPLAELLLYEAARAQLLAEVIEPALDAGETVLCDRFFDSTTAYQGYARGLSLELVATLNRAATGGRVPDRTIVFDIEPELGLGRATAQGADRLESEGMAFHRAVRDGFLALASEEPERVTVIDANGTPEQVSARLESALGDLQAIAKALETSG